MPRRSADSRLFSPHRIRGLELPNRVVVPPMAQYSAIDGIANAHHLVHYGKFAMGGAGTVFLEATGVTRAGRITNGCLGLWSDAHRDAMRPIVDFLKANGTIPAIQLGHGGRKASMQRPWHGNGPLTDTDLARGDECWPIIAPSALPLDDGWLEPRAMDARDLQETGDAFADAARRAVEAGFEIVEIHMAHGYLLQTFLSPLSNRRSDAYGGDRDGRMRFPLEVAARVRAAIPDAMPLFVRISSIDGIDGGWTLDDSVVLARELKARGVDVIDCSSGGNSPKGATNTNLRRGPGFQVPFADRIRNEADIQTMAVGLIRDAGHAEEILRAGQADLIAVGRQHLFDPFWTLHQAHDEDRDPDFTEWPQAYGWWLEKWDKGIKASR
ncbi:MAG: NADH:flavin oxidoreductase/NADH oxidase [Burkholderiaceae bacterium]|nr:NADH:flavin oxidoreductase/NADH oxidase [Burkholderiaceae bacterium]